MYEGVLSDPQDADNISLVDAPGMVHFIQLVHADEPLNIEVREEDGFTHGQAEANQTAFLSSSEGIQCGFQLQTRTFLHRMRIGF